MASKRSVTVSRAARVARPLLCAAGAALWAISCGGAQTGGCPLENWSGVCELTSFTKLRDVEMPVPHSVYEAIYTPVKQASSTSYTPPAVRLELNALSRYEPQLEQHMRAYRQIACQQTIRDGCAYNPVVAQLPEFNPAAYAQAEATGPRGCEKIESEGAGSGIGRHGSESLPEHFYFALNSSELDQQMPQLAQSVAGRLRAEPAIECVGVVGQSAAGESPGLAELRAQQIKRLLTQYGVESYRMMTVSTSTPLYGAGNERQAPKADDQKVSVTIILRGGAAAPAPPAVSPQPPMQ